jgi:hypothetical protein
MKCLACEQPVEGIAMLCASCERLWDRAVVLALAYQAQQNELKNRLRRADCAK